LPLVSAQGQRRKVKKPKPAPAAQGPRLTVDQWERAYMNQDKKTMILKLMTPQTDDNGMQRRYQWLRGYGPKDAPYPVPPILFEPSKAPFVPNKYQILPLSPGSAPAEMRAVVREEGSYKDEVPFKVTRVRQIDLRKVGSRWLIHDYYLKENKGVDLGF